MLIMSVLLLQTLGCLFSAMHPLRCVLRAQGCLRLGPLASGSQLQLRTCRAHSSHHSTASLSSERQQENEVRKDFTSKLDTGPTFQDFLRSASAPQEKPSSPDVEDPPPYLTADELLGRQRKGWFYVSSLFGLPALFLSNINGLILFFFCRPSQNA